MRNTVLFVRESRSQALLGSVGEGGGEEDLLVVEKRFWFLKEVCRVAFTAPFKAFRRKHMTEDNDVF